MSMVCVGGGGGEVGVLGRDPVVHALGIDNFHHKFMP